MTDTPRPLRERLLEIRQRLEAWREAEGDKEGDDEIQAIFITHTADDIAFLLPLAEALAGIAALKPKLPKLCPWCHLPVWVHQIQGCK